MSLKFANGHMSVFFFVFSLIPKKILRDQCFRIDADEKVDLEDMHTTLKKAGDKSLTLYGGDPSRNLSNWIKSEFNEEMANGQVSIKKSGTCRRVFGFASL